MCQFYSKEVTIRDPKTAKSATRPAKITTPDALQPARHNNRAQQRHYAIRVTSSRCIAHTVQMSGVVTGQARSAGWNINIACGAENGRVAGVFHPPGSDSLTFRDILDELRLCFDFRDMRDNQTDGAGSRSGIALAHEGFTGEQAPAGAGPDGTHATPSLIWGDHLDQIVHTRKGSDPDKPPRLQLRVVRHTGCRLGPVPLADHLRGTYLPVMLLSSLEVCLGSSLTLTRPAGCAMHLPPPSLRRDNRYLPPNKPSNDSRVSGLPYRKTFRSSSRRGSQSPRKRSASGSMSGSVSPTKDTSTSNALTESGGATEDITDVIAPPTLNMSSEKARQIMSNFRSACLVQDKLCAVTGKGRPWFNNPVGPAVQACHIVPQHHYHVYPVPDSYGERFDVRRLREAWNRTWRAENGILLLSHLHELFDARLFSIHPDTLRVRAFVPYDVLLEYHGTVAVLNEDVDRQALRHHYEMCCMENMAAKMNLSEVMFEPASLLPSGSISPFQSASHTPFAGDPAKSARDGPSTTVVSNESRGSGPYKEQDMEEEFDRDTIRSAQGPALTDGSSAGSIADTSQSMAHTGRVSDSLKRQRLEHDIGGFEHGTKRHQRGYDAFDVQYITPTNSKVFLEQVNCRLEQ